MAKTTKPLSGSAKDKFLRGVVDGVDGVTADTSTRISRALTGAIAEVRARRDVWEGQRRAPIATPVARAQVQAQTETRPAAPAATTAQQTVTPATAFDPYAFSAVALLTKKGRAALATALDQIATVDQLRQLAVAQHLAVEPTIQDASALRAAVVAATERRIAERKAAAS